MFQTVVPVALRKSPYVTILEKSRNVPNGLLKMCPRLEPQRHFEAACCRGIANAAMVWVSYIWIHFHFRSGWGHFRVRIRRSNTMSEFVHIALFGHLFCSDLHQAVFELWYTGPRLSSARMSASASCLEPREARRQAASNKLSLIWMNLGFSSNVLECS